MQSDWKKVPGNRGWETLAGIIPLHLLPAGMPANCQARQSRRNKRRQCVQFSPWVRIFQLIMLSSKDWDLMALQGLTMFNILLMEEILHQLIGSLSHYLQGFIHVRWCRISSTNSMIPIWYDFHSHSRYLSGAKTSPCIGGSASRLGRRASPTSTGADNPMHSYGKTKTVHWLDEKF